MLWACYCLLTTSGLAVVGISLVAAILKGRDDDDVSQLNVLPIPMSCLRVDGIFIPGSAVSNNDLLKRLAASRK